MRIIRALIATTAIVLGSAITTLAADVTGAEIKALLSGKTSYLETTAASASGKVGQGVIYWAADGTALYKTPAGSIMHGTWTTKGDQLCVDWKEKPNNGCVRYAKEGDKVTVHDAQSGALRATVVKTAAGNAEKIAP
jgi:hypothetical protein